MKYTSHGIHVSDLVLYKWVYFIVFELTNNTFMPSGVPGVANLIHGKAESMEQNMKDVSGDKCLSVKLHLQYFSIILN